MILFFTVIGKLLVLALYALVSWLGINLLIAHWQEHKHQQRKETQRHERR